LTFSAFGVMINALRERAMSNSDKIAKAASLSFPTRERQEAGYRYLREPRKPRHCPDHNIKLENGRCSFCKVLARKKRELHVAERQAEKDRNWRSIIEPRKSKGRKPKRLRIRHRSANECIPFRSDQICRKCNGPMTDYGLRVICDFCRSQKTGQFPEKRVLGDGSALLPKKPRPPKPPLAIASVDPVSPPEWKNCPLCEAHKTIGRLIGDSRGVRCLSCGSTWRGGYIYRLMKKSRGDAP
jgi:hypothetical protein